ncbi:MAG TPA: hypothetical protein VFZ01_20535 [Geminicoccaceae bacterium]
MAKGLAAGLGAIGLLIGGGVAAQSIGDGSGDGVVGTTEVAFFVTLDRDGAEETILAFGGLRLFVRCDLGAGGAGDRIDLIVESRLDDWFVVKAGRSTSQPRRAGDEVTLGTAKAAVGAPLLQGLAGHEIALAPDGAFLSLATGSSVLGVNVLDHRCVAIGRVEAIRGAPDSAAGRRFEDGDGSRFSFEAGPSGGRFRFRID